MTCVNVIEKKKTEDVTDMINNCKPLNTSFNRRITVAQTGSLLRRLLIDFFLFSNWKIRKSNKLKLKNIRKKLGNEISLRVKQKDRRDPCEFNPKREIKSTDRLWIPWNRKDVSRDDEKLRGRRCRRGRGRRVGSPLRHNQSSASNDARTSTR